MTRKDDEIAELKHESAAQHATIAALKQQRDTARTLAAARGVELEDCDAVIAANRKTIAQQRAEIEELRLLLRGATAQQRDALKELDDLATVVGRTVRPPEWLPERVRANAATDFVLGWLGRSTQYGPRVAAHVVMAAHE